MAFKTINLFKTFHFAVHNPSQSKTLALIQRHNRADHYQGKLEFKLEMFKIQNIIAAINLQNVQVLKRTEECWNLVVRLNGKLVRPFQPQYQQTNSPDLSPYISLKHS